MIKLKKKYVQIIISIALLVLFAVVNYSNLLLNYYELFESSGLVKQDIMDQVNKENEQAVRNEEEYKKLINPENKEEEADEGNKDSNDNLTLHAQGSLLMDASNNRVLYEENGDTKMAMASTTKIMTCIVTLENSDLNDVVTVSSYASKMPDVQLNMRPGDKYYLKDLLYSLMLESHNDTAVAIAEHVGGSVGGFATMMNEKAKSLGCNHTNFVTPNGLDAKDHYTTPRDLAVIASYAIKNDLFIKITNTASHAFKEITKGKTYQVANKNRFLYMMDGAIGVKTGFTGAAGYCFVGAIKHPDRTLVSVVLGCGWPPSKTLKWHDTLELMNYGIKNFKSKQIFEKINLDPVFVDDGVMRYEKLNLNGDLSLLMSKNDSVRIDYELPNKLQAPVKAKSIVGYANYYINDQLYEKLPIYAVEDIDRIDLTYCLKKLFHLWSLDNEGYERTQ